MRRSTRRTRRQRRCDLFPGTTGSAAQARLCHQLLDLQPVEVGLAAQAIAVPLGLLAGAFAVFQAVQVRQFPENAVQQARLSLRPAHRRN
ncbi:hypothetical protein [Defluviicoccus vanus]|uniref:Uncharacterized protein n=1 Tax=Defluviicoccus vanus TaxID=111831 RepID=A0A7H1MZM9_9PROT|nr:hypothetical protein [Defluviicoccus vanus]QNT68915.1 hypothetical protein HQ394_05535 [Defluviicoccus vanus]